MQLMRLFSCLLFVSLALDSTHGKRPPNILLIVADDLGYNDVGYHNPEMFTKNIDKVNNVL